MTEKQKQAKLAKLNEKLSDLKSKLYKAQCEEREKLNRMGWGYGMRHAKIGFSTRKSDRIKERIEICEQQIKELSNPTKWQHEKKSAVIKGWICRDKELDRDLFDSDLSLCHHKPTRNETLGVWMGGGGYILIPSQFFPSLTWHDDPIEVEITIKSKKQ